MASPTSSVNPGRCTHASLSERGSFSLPVLAEHNPRGQIRKSKNSRRRAVVLIGVQLLLIAHIVMWVIGRNHGWFGGATVSPIEPSESMQFVERGAINAGLIFFGIALLATLVLGRWFCGWGCHIVMLQDFCGWIMKKCGVRPRAFRSRLLMYVPLILALYMFVWPAVFRWGILPLDAWMAREWGIDHWAVHTMRGVFGLFQVPLGHTPLPWETKSELVRADFWATFPQSAWIIVPFLLVCGFATVYFLGSKGFCTYGCPYGGFFAPLDKLATGRILVTDACEGCGHCTAVCTSNVRVHEEVREYGMVVDPGCMKCMDCVSVCPNDALYFGFAKPAIVKGPAKNKAPKKAYDLSILEEILCAVIFLLVFMSVRGVYSAVPMLMAAGVAGIVTFLVWKLWRLGRDPNVTLNRFQLTLRGKLRPAAWVFTGAVVLVMAFVIHCGTVNAWVAAAQWHQAKVTISPEQIFSGAPPTMPPDMAAHADRALALYRRASSISEGGIGLLGTWQSDLDFRMARLLSAKLDFAGAEKVLRHAIDRDGPRDAFCSSVMWTMAGDGRFPEAIAYGRDLLAQHADYLETLDTYVQLATRTENLPAAEAMVADIIHRSGVSDRTSSALTWIIARQEGRTREALDYARGILIEHLDYTMTMDAFVNIAGAFGDTQMITDACRERLAKYGSDVPKDKALRQAYLHTTRWLAVVLREMSSYVESAELTRRTIEIDPHNPAAYQYLAMTLIDLAQMDEAVAQMQHAVDIAPNNPQLNTAMADLLDWVKRPDEAKKYRDRAVRLEPPAEQIAPPMDSAGY